MQERKAERSLDALRDLWASEKVSTAAAWALVNHPYREAAKTEYFAMLAHPSDITNVGRACVQFGWTDALPLMEDICATATACSSSRRPC